MHFSNLSKSSHTVYVTTKFKCKQGWGLKWLKADAPCITHKHYISSQKFKNNRKLHGSTQTGMNNAIHLAIGLLR